jgi:glycolate oxidase iron-sulfur subunit
MATDPKFEQLERFKNDIKGCIECGNCTFWCPIYQEEPVESSVARGKIKMIKALLSGEVDYTKEFADLLGTCTLCMACTEHCPVKTQVQSIIAAMRADKVKTKGIPFPSKMVYRWLLPRRKLFGNVARVASWLQGLVFPRTEGTIRHLPLFLSALGQGRHFPSIASRFLRQKVPAVNKPPKGVETKMRIGYFIGCATDFIFPDVGEKVIRFLTNHGVEVVVPKAQGCCGAPIFLGAGDLETSRKMADTNVKAFENLDYVVSNCATCSSALKDYVKQLADTPERQETYKTFGSKVKDISQFLVDVLKLPLSDYQPSPEVQGKKVTWHDPCHLVRYLGVKRQPRHMIKSLPNVEYIEMARADSCCGMAGSFSISYYDLSKKIADRKADAVQATGADIVATACPGCMIQLIDTFRRRKMPQKVLHLMDLFK